MEKKLAQRVEEGMRQGKDRRTLLRELADDGNREELRFHLNNSATASGRKENQYINLLLAVILLFLTSKRALVAFTFGGLNLYLLLDLVVPIINIYLLREVLRFHRLGYLSLALLTTLSLLRPENRSNPDLSLALVMIVLAGFLYLRLFPRGEQLPRS